MVRAEDGTKKKRFGWVDIEEHMNIYIYITQNIFSGRSFQTIEI